MSTNLDKWKSSLTLDDAKELIKQSSCSMCPRFMNKTCEGYSKLYRHELNHRIAHDICDDRLDIYFKQEAKDD